MDDYIKIPHRIEEKSFEIITEELGSKTFSEDVGKIIKRIIHTTADFQYAETTQISPGAIDIAKAVMRAGTNIITDTKMVMAGINKNKLEQFGCSVNCLISHEDVIETAKQKGITRAMAAIEKAVLDKNNKIFVIGNAPTALFQLKEYIEKGIIRPELVIGVPVGFVGAVESKEAFSKLDIPYIITKGRKGGSTVAAAIVNAILYML